MIFESFAITAISWCLGLHTSFSPMLFESNTLFTACPMADFGLHFYLCFLYGYCRNEANWDMSALLFVKLSHELSVGWPACSCTFYGVISNKAECSHNDLFKTLHKLTCNIAVLPTMRPVNKAELSTGWQLGDVVELSTERSILYMETAWCIVEFLDRSSMGFCGKCHACMHAYNYDHFYCEKPKSNQL